MWGVQFWPGRPAAFNSDHKRETNRRRRGAQGVTNVAPAYTRLWPSASRHQNGHIFRGAGRSRLQRPPVADVVAMNTWPSRGLAVHGIEVKVSRSDWLRELKDPAKSASVQRFCDRWWLAAGDDKVAKMEEVPEAWGLLVLRGKALVQVKEALPMPAEPLTRGFAATLLRNATTTWPCG